MHNNRIVFIYLHCVYCFNHVLLPVSGLVVPSAVAAPVSVPTSESSTSADKPAKSKAELKAERRARQEADRTAKQAKKEPGTTSTSKPKAPQSDLQPGNMVTVNRS